MTALDNYEKAANELARDFLKKLYPDDPDNYCDWYWVGRTVGGVMSWGDWFVDTTVMANFFRCGLTSDEFFDWYDQWVEDKKGKLNIMNFKNKNNVDLLKDF